VTEIGPILCRVDSVICCDARSSNPPQRPEFYEILKGPGEKIRFINHYRVPCSMEFKLFHQIAENLTALGSMVFFGIVFIFTFLTDRWISYQLLFATLVSFSLIVLIRLIYFKERPENKGKNKKVSHFVDIIDSSSFPSMHSTNSFIIALILGLNQKSVWVFVFLVLVATLISMTRYYFKKHYPIDIIVGMALGIITSLITVFLVF
jgi:undecaprenyl-diphosphatase